MAAKSVVIIDDEDMIATMIEAWLVGFGGFKVVGIANRGGEGLDLCRKLQPDLVLLDIEMPQMDGLEVARTLKANMLSSRIIILTSHLNPRCIYEISRLGIHGYVNKTDSLTVLGEAFRQVAQGGHYYSPVYQMIREKKLAGPDAYQKILAPKEVAVLILLAQGMDDLAIAGRLDITPLTVATHRRNVRVKLDAHNDRDLIQYAQRWGLISLDQSDRTL